MSIQQISPNSVAANPAYMNSQVKSDQSKAIPQVNQTAQHSVQAFKTDTVTISQQALQKLANDGDTQVKESKESYSEAAREKLKGKA
ncbi:MAG: hypothetical protein M0Z78_06545 [Betaproteobacteria bacterium]|nr:hypothetical protein [Betaproteobacteria bacterium]